MTDTDKIPVSFNCKLCGEGLSWSEDATEFTEISCKKCGTRFGTYGDLRDTAIDAARSKIESMFDDAFKRR